MTEEVKKSLGVVYKTMDQMDIYRHAAKVLQYDQETICPEKAMEEQGEITAFLENKAFALTKTKKYIDAVAFLYKNKSQTKQMALHTHLPMLVLHQGD